MQNDNNSGKLSIKGRKFILSKIAKDQKDSLLKGKYNRKELEKIRDKSVKKYNEIRNNLSKSIKEKERLEKNIQLMQNEVSGLREDISLCHKILSNMDFTNAEEVKISKNNNDVAYACDGSWMYYEEGDLIPYSEWRRLKREKNKEQENNDDDDDNNNEDSENDINFDDFDLDPEGIDLKV